MGVSGWMFLLVPAYPGCPGSKAVKRSLLLLLLSGEFCIFEDKSLSGVHDMINHFACDFAKCSLIFTTKLNDKFAMKRLIIT